MNKKDRKIVFDKYEGKCAYCGCELEKRWHVDHFLPLERQKLWITHKNINGRFVPGKLVNNGVKYPERDTIENMMPSCSSCNINKHEMSIENFRKQISAYMKHLNESSTQYKLAKRYGLIKETNASVKFYFETHQNEIL